MQHSPEGAEYGAHVVVSMCSGESWCPWTVTIAVCRGGSGDAGWMARGSPLAAGLSACMYVHVCIFELRIYSVTIDQGQSGQLCLIHTSVRRIVGCATVRIKEYDCECTYCADDHG